MAADSTRHHVERALHWIAKEHQKQANVMFSELFDQHASGELDTNELDDALWLALCKFVDDRHESFAGLPLAVRNYFASRYVECEVGNGGFAQAAYNVPHLFDAAREGYSALGLDGAADLIAEAQPDGRWPCAVRHRPDG
jgi:hypothetical protein